MYGAGYWGSGHFGQSYWPPVATETEERTGGSFGRGFVPIAARNEERRASIERVLTVATRRSLAAVVTDRLDLDVLENEVQRAFERAPARSRRVSLENTERFIITPPPGVQRDDDMNVRFLLLLGW